MKVQIDRTARWFALAWALMAYVLLLVLPLSATITTNVPDGAVRAGHTSLLSENDSRVFVSLAVPVLAAALAFLPVRPPRRRAIAGIGATIAMIYAILGSMTVGVFFLPTAVALIMAARTPRTDVDSSH